jgi:hypothetical protein
MAAAGVVAYGPFPWADQLSTDDVDRVLGERRVLWLETAHFRIGSTLAAAPMPEAQTQRKALLDELRDLRRRLPKAPPGPRRLDPWLRLHLYAQRAEDLYASFQRLLGVTDASFAGGPEPPDGRYLGLPDKFLLLLFQKKADLARYLDRFCGVHSELPLRHYHQKSKQMLFVVAVEGFEQFDEPALHSHVVYSLAHNLLSGYRGYAYALPQWLAEGLAHWYSRHVETAFINVAIRDADAVNDLDKHEWAKKVRLRAQHDGATFAFEQMLAWQKFDDLGYQAHVQSWSRVDWLMSLDPQKVGQLVHRLKSLPPPVDAAGMPHATLVQAQLAALAEIFQLDPASFDRRWREWVLKAYARQ